MKVHIWFPELVRSKGGIQVFSKFFLSALAAELPAAQLRLFCKNDRPEALARILPPGVNATCAGRWPGAARTAAFVAQIVPAAVRERPDLIICGHLNFAVVADWVRRWLGIPFWVIAHGIEAWNLRRPGLLRAGRASSRILAVSRFTRDRLLAQLEVPPERVKLLPNTFDDRGLGPGPKPPYLLARYGLSPQQPVILTVARLSSPERYKGYDKIIDALPDILEAVPNAHYVLVGKGDDRARVEARIRGLGIEDHVSLAGFVPEAELRDHYNLCDVFAMPSKGEGFGIVFLEALACGKPVLAGNQDGSRDALCDGELGVLVDPDDVPAIAGALTAILLRRHPHPLMYDPPALREAVLSNYGFARFATLLREQLRAFDGRI